MHAIKRKIEHAGFGAVPTSPLQGNGKPEMQLSPSAKGHARVTAAGVYN
jgi:hypothetical protein